METEIKCTTSRPLEFVINGEQTSTSCSTWTCNGDNHIFIFTGHQILEGSKCICGKQKVHYQTCPTCNESKIVYLDV